MTIKTLGITVGTACLLLAGCYEAADVTTHEPGVYKGPQDPLLQTDADARAEVLQKRFNMVQTDR